MKVLLIGGTGNISAACARRLHEDGHGVSIVSRGNEPVPEWARSFVADRRDREALRRAAAAASPEVVINFLGFDVSDVRIDYEVFRDRVLQYIFISSTTVYAKPHRQLPLVETAMLGNRFSEYARKKEQSEVWLLARHARSGFPVTIVRPSHTYSERWLPNPVASAGYTFGARLMAGDPVFVHDEGKTEWTLTAASDFAVGLSGLVGNQAADGEAIHITSDEVLTWNDIYAATIRALGAPSPRVIKVPSQFVSFAVPEMEAKLQGDKAAPGIFDNTKIRRLVPSYTCTKLFRHGVQEAVDWFRADPGRQRRDPETDAVFDRVARAWQRRQNA